MSHNKEKGGAMGMAIENTATRSEREESFFAELFSTRLYKPTQGRVTRQTTGGAIWLIFAIGAWRWYSTAAGLGWLAEMAGTAGTTEGEASIAATLDVLRIVLPLLLLVVGVWIGYRAVNYPKFADFLIAVEAEMNKVMWPSQDELVRSSVVVIMLLISFAALMYVFDVVWYFLFWITGVRAS